jgi:hypothetical protein
MRAEWVLVKKSVLAISAAAFTVVGFTVVGCGSSSKSADTSSASSSSSSSSSASATSAASKPANDFASLLIKPEDIELPGDTFTAQEPMVNPGGKDGVATAFTNQTQTRTIGDTILVLADATEAEGVLKASLDAVGQSVADGTPGPLAVGSNGTLVAGNSPDGTKAVTVVLFTEGKAFVTLEFDSAAGDPVPPEFATAVAQKQDDALKAGLPG